MNVLRIGMKIDITPEPDGLKEELTEDIIYSSQIQDIFPNGDLEIDMPVHQRKLILLHNGVRYQFVFHSEKNTYISLILASVTLAAIKSYIFLSLLFLTKIK